MQEAILTDPCQSLLFSEHRQQHGQHRCTAVQRQECLLEQLSFPGYETRPDCELLEMRSLIKNSFLHFSAAAEGFTGPRQRRKHVQHVLLCTSQCFNLFLYTN